MRTTLDIDEDVLLAAKELARHQGITAGQVISDLSRQALTGDIAKPVPPKRSATGFRPFAPRGNVVTNALIDKLRDESGV
jgi:hypothetical protein